MIEYLSNAYKVLIFKSETFKDLIIFIATKEKEMFSTRNQNIINMYKKNTNYTNKIVYVYVTIGTVGIVGFFLIPLINNIVIPFGYNNVTGVKEHHFIMHTWFPFDANKYYWVTYFVQLTGCFYGYAYIIYCGAFFLTVLTFVTCQLKILQYLLENFQSYAEKMKVQFSLTKEQSETVLVKKLIMDHMNCISFVHKLNDSVKMFMLMNFLISSFQLSLVIYEIFLIPLVNRIPIFLFFVTLSIQLFLIYNSAHEIKIQNENVGVAIFKSEWYALNPKVAKAMQMMMVRAQRPLVMTIGPMGEVNVTSLIQIFKAIYSYACLILRH
ncbi:odorant receptor 30a-like [Sitophilus oryzae]|uniref:Odorant receptor 30a-like n=1 Tax=Sitophilus oryzae TaxID=7048 RepID=A0A6J2Y9U5_SITOR|nr:odorant receptor 30a-like [Sitophilus oryzae]